MNDDFVTDLKMIALLGVAFGFIIVWLREPAANVSDGLGCSFGPLELKGNEFRAPLRARLAIAPERGRFACKECPTTLQVGVSLTAPIVQVPLSGQANKVFLRRNESAMFDVPSV